MAKAGNLYKITPVHVGVFSFILYLFTGWSPAIDVFVTCGIITLINKI